MTRHAELLWRLEPPRPAVAAELGARLRKHLDWATLEEWFAKRQMAAGLRPVMESGPARPS